MNHDNRRTSPPGVTPVACCGLLWRLWRAAAGRSCP